MELREVTFEIASYEAPQVETIMSADDLEREFKYAGETITLIVPGT